MGEVHAIGPTHNVVEPPAGTPVVATSHTKLIEFLATTRGITEYVVLEKNGTIISYQSNRPVLKNALTFIATKAEQAGSVFGFTGFRYVAMQRGGGKKLIILTGSDVLIGLEADTLCLQQILLDSLRLLLIGGHSEVN